MSSASPANRKSQAISVVTSMSVLIVDWTRSSAWLTKARGTTVAESPTTITFDEPGTLQYICHLPGHEAYGMVGTLTVEG